MDENQKMINEVTKSISETVEKALPEIVDSVVSKKVEELSTKTLGEIEDVKAEIKKINFNSKTTDKGLNELANKTAVVSVFKEVLSNNVTSEKAFQEVVNKVFAGLNEGTATEGAEFVFDQFENDVIKIINTYDIVNDVKILPLAKGDKVSIPKVTNGITTYWTAESVAYTASKPDTAFVTINIAKATTLTDVTVELMEDSMTIPDLYNMLVELIGESQAEFLETEILLGAGEVKGIFLNADVNAVALTAGQTATDIDDAKLVEIVTTAKMKFKRKTNNVKWYMSQYVFGLIKALVTTDGYPLYPSLREATPTLMGYKVVFSDVGFVQDLAEDIADAITLMFGDLSYYTIVRRKGLSIEKGYYGDNWASDIVSVKSNQRVWGECTYGEAITILANGA